MLGQLLSLARVILAREEYTEFFHTESWSTQSSFTQSRDSLETLLQSGVSSTERVLEQRQSKSGRSAISFVVENCLVERSVGKSVF